MYNKFKLIKGEKGQSLVEFAIVLPVLMLFLLGIIEFGWLFNAKITLTSAAREGARIYAIEGNNQTLVEDAVNKATSNLIVNKIEVDKSIGVVLSEETTTSGNIRMAKVVITAEVIPLIKLIVKNNVTMKAEASMRIEYKTTP